ncbi:uncharacterized protein LOC143465963 isoform X2 [Clavelina lepadiformis]|uniref:uncharacterized protein LOC143465963 isoform X2 n=1 Tax=Clavelina lepadiformis TaxID=159417 RepID=UPI00404379B2
MSTSRFVRPTRQRGLMATALDVTSETPLNSSGRFNHSGGSAELQKSVDDTVSLHGVDTRENKRGGSTGSDNVFSQHTSESGRIHSFREEENSQLLYHNKVSLSSANLCHNSSNNQQQEVKKERLTRQSSLECPLKTIQEDSTASDEGVSLASTQHLRTGFFRTIKRQYPSLTLDGLFAVDSCRDSGNERNDEKSEEEENVMSNIARKRLRELRKVDPTKVDVATGLQWIRLELHEMREQDKSLFLQLIKLHTTIKELRSEMNFQEHDSDGSYDDINDAASLWWPRSNSGSILPDFSSSDGAQLMRSRRTPDNFRRGMSLNYHRPTRFAYPSRTASSSYQSLSTGNNIAT